MVLLYLDMICKYNLLRDYAEISKKLLETINTSLCLSKLSLKLLDLLSIRLFDICWYLFVVFILSLSNSIIESLFNGSCVGLKFLVSLFDINDTNDLQEDLELIVNVNLHATLWISIFSFQETSLTTFDESAHDLTL